MHNKNLFSPIIFEGEQISCIRLSRQQQKLKPWLVHVYHREGEMKKSFLQCAKITICLLVVYFLMFLKSRVGKQVLLLIFCSVPRPYKLDCPSATLQLQVLLHVCYLHLKYMHWFKINHKNCLINTQQNNLTEPYCICRLHENTEIIIMYILLPSNNNPG